VLWKALPEHNPTKLDSTQNSISTASGDFPKINYTQCLFNYYCKNKSSKIAKPVSQARYQYKLTLETEFTQKYFTKKVLKFPKVRSGINLQTQPC
jgi:hypothetical protein